MQGSWTAVVDPEDTSRIIITRGRDSVTKYGGFKLSDLDWLTHRLRSMEIYEANLMADPFMDPNRPDPLIAELRRIRIEKGLTFTDISAPMGSNNSIIKRAEEGRSIPTWSNLKLWAWLLGRRIVLAEGPTR